MRDHTKRKLRVWCMCLPVGSACTWKMMPIIAAAIGSSSKTTDTTSAGKYLSNVDSACVRGMSQCRNVRGVRGVCEDECRSNVDSVRVKSVPVLCVCSA